MYCLGTFLKQFSNKSLNSNGNMCLRDTEFCHQFLLLQGIHRILNFVSVFESRAGNIGIRNCATFEERNFEVAFLLQHDGSVTTDNSIR